MRRIAASNEIIAIKEFIAENVIISCLHESVPLYYVEIRN